MSSDVPAADPEPTPPVASRGLAGVLDRMPLRVKLVAALLTLVTFGLVASGLAATAALRGYLLNRVDEQLEVAAATVAQRFDNDRRFGGPRGQLLLPGSYFVRLSNLDGTPVDATALPVGLAAPVVLGPEDLARVAELFTVAATRGDTRWRVVNLPVRDNTYVVTVAAQLDDVERTTRRLLLLEAVVGLAVLLLLGAAGYAVVRRSLRPLVEVEGTAGAIAAGDLSRRVPERDARTEVGRLARAFNAMVSQIEAAFRDRQRAADESRASEERMRRFVADASHELRTPLTSIRGFAELYRQGAVASPDEVARVMRRVEDEAARMGVLVEDLLLLARLDQQRPLDRRPVDLLVLAGDAVQDARALAPDRSIELRMSGPTAPVVIGDEARLRQVVGNLLSNALTHTPAGTPVRCTLGSDGAMVLLEVSDDGPGMSSEDAAHAFERFYRAERSRTRTAGGSGLGLSIVAALVAAHGGTITLQTAPQRGARFIVRLPGAGGGAPVPPDLPQSEGAATGSRLAAG